MEDATTIAVKRSTLRRLKAQRQYGRESYDETINRLVEMSALAEKNRQRKEEARKSFLETIGKGFDLGLKSKRIYKERGELYDR